jgi:hypothetical protein
MRSRVCFLSLRNSTQELVRGKHAWHGAVGVSRWFMMYRDRRWGIVLFFFVFFYLYFRFVYFFFPSGSMQVNIQKTFLEFVFENKSWKYLRAL